MAVQMTLGDLRRILSQIGTGHDAKPIAILNAGKVINLDAVCVMVQGDRILFEAIKPAPKHPKVTEAMRAGLGWK